MAKSKLRAGAATANITPPLGVTLDGTISQNGPATHIHDELQARCLVLDDGDNQLAFVICDSTMINRVIFDEAKQIVHDSTSFPIDRILMAATHTHSAPRVIGIGQNELDLFYLELMIHRLADAIRCAMNNLAPAQIGWGSVNKPEHVFNRRWKMKPNTIPANPFGGRGDRVRMNPRAGSSDLVEPAGPVDLEVFFLSIQHADGRPLALLANYGLHYVGGTGRGNISADYFGAFAERIQQRLRADRSDPSFVGIMSNGTSGDVNNTDFRKKRERKKPYVRIREVANGVADAVFEASRNITYRSDITLDGRTESIELGVRTPKAIEVERAKVIMAQSGTKQRLTRPEVYARETIAMQDWKATRDTTVQAFRIGPVGVTAMPCEVFAETGLQIKKQSPLKPTFTIELANDYCGYLPTVAQHALGGYETWRARSSFLEVEAEPKLRDKVLRLLQQVSRSS